jgi:mannose-6-phosphate isomerase-like protein (cupin superfamily)
VIGEVEMSSRSNTARRVITGVDEDGKSCIWLDGDVPESAIVAKGEDGRIGRSIWAIDEIPTIIKNKFDPMENWFQDHEWFPDKGINFGLLTWEPGTGYPMHVTESLDIGVIVSGELELILEKESTVLGAGDCFVQNGTQHGWKVVGDEPCTFVVVIVAKKQEED